MGSGKMRNYIVSKFEYSKKYIFSYFLYELTTKSHSNQYCKLTGKEVNIISPFVGYIDYKNKYYYVTPSMCFEVKNKES